ncbi:MAG: PTS sugar transporter subunit IIA [Thermovenabulum sp.]|uniref:PTS sugar transporter subunit IIA n=1 Tax=Thermovenabulum sp. TaxID=3100335 RepID=UPI003C7AA365
MVFGFLKKNNSQNKNGEIIKESMILVGAKVKDKFEAIRLAGEILVKEGYVEPEYIDAMFEREKQISTYIGNFIAIPHGVGESRKYIKKTGISVVHIPDGVDFGDNNTAHLVIGIAALGDEHLNILANIATLFDDKDRVKKLINNASKKGIYEFLNGRI